MRTFPFFAAFLCACSASPQGAVPLDGGGGEGGGHGGDAATEAGSDGGGMEAGDDGGSCSGGGGMTCTMCTGTGKSGQQCVTTVAAKVTDASGMPVSCLTLFVCGTDLCTLPTQTNAAGAIELDACEYLTKPALKVFADPQWVAFAALVSGTGPSYDAGTLSLVALPAQGVAFPGAGMAADLTSNGVTLSVAADSFKFDLEHQDANSQMFRAAAVDPSKLPFSLGGSVVDVAFGLAPLNTQLTTAAKLTVPNTKGWAASAAVDVFLNGSDSTVAMPAAPWGTWGPIGTAHVSADGMTITTDTGAGNGVPEIAMVGLKLHM